MKSKLHQNAGVLDVGGELRLQAVTNEIVSLARKHKQLLKEKTLSRVEEMAFDDPGHEMIYRCFGVSLEEGRNIDLYQNKGRLLYRAAGTFLEQATKICLEAAFPGCASVRIPNKDGTRPKMFEIDCLVNGVDALEIKWRHSTTDGDHILKEHLKAQTIAEFGYKPIRVMFFQPNRTQSIRIQRAIATLYTGLGGEYYAGTDAWDYVERRTGIDLYGIISKIAEASVTAD